MTLQWHAERKPLAWIKEHQNNPRQATKQEIDDLRSSIDKFGMAEPLVCNIDGSLIGGHARLHVLKERGEVEADVWLPNRPLAQIEIDELLLRLNKNVMQWDNERLAMFDLNMLKDSGFRGKRLAAITGDDDFDEEAAKAKLAEFQGTCPRCGFKPGEPVDKL